MLGDGGLGKTRLAREAVALATAAGLPVLAGRSVPGANPVPYRAVAEGLLAAFRSTPAPRAPDLAAFDGYLVRLIPDWPGTSPARVDESPVLFGEAVLRLLRSMAGGRGCLLLLEDLHWADAETLAVVEYLSDAARDEPVLCLCTARQEGAASELLDRLERRDPLSVIRVAPLGGPDVDRMVEACLSTPTPPADVVEFLRRHSDGNPFLVEELLAGLVAMGQLAVEDGRWVSRGGLTARLPRSLHDSIRRRLTGLDRVTRRVVDAAALLGRRFDWELLPGICEVDGRAVVHALRKATGDQLIVADGSGFSFRHALTREAVLAEVLPPDRRELAARAWPAIERANPGLPGPICELAAELAEAAGERVAAALRLVESARRALASGALSSAEAAARRARELAGSDRNMAAVVDEVMVHVFVAAGKAGEALELGRRVVADPVGHHAEGAQRAEMLVAVARAAVTAGDPRSAEEMISQARSASGSDAEGGSAGPALAARIDAVAAHVALERNRLEDAEALARSAVEASGRTDQPEVACEALEVLGRLARVSRPGESNAWFEQEADLARTHGLARWHLRAQHELALTAWTRADFQPLRDTRDLAVRYGAMITVAVMDLSLADIALSAFDRDASLTAARCCVEASRRYGLATEPIAWLWLAGAYALAGDDGQMNAAIDRALTRDPDDPRILADLYGRVLVTRAVVADELDSLPALLDTSMEYVRRAPPAASIYPGRLLWATVHTVTDDDFGVGARAECTAAVERIDMPVLRAARDVYAAAALARQGDAERSQQIMRDALAAFGRTGLGTGMGYVQILVVARAALREGWGEPVVWLREAGAFFAAGGYDRAARRCRLLLAETGAPVSRRGRGDSAVPTTLRALGVTSREVDVLKLAAAGLSTKAIAEALFLSPKTVERHLSSLSDRTGVRGRRALTDVARRHGLTPA